MTVPAAGPSQEPSGPDTAGGPGCAAAAGWVDLPDDPTAAALAAAIVAPRGLPPAAPLQAWWEPPEGPARAGVLVLPEVFGLNAWVRSVCRRLAGAGYAALAVPLFSRTAPGLELDYSAASLQEGRRHKEQTSEAGLLHDVARAAAWLEGQLGRRGGLGCLGFCFGGHVTLLAAQLPCIAASCDCYGAGVASGRPGGGPPTLAVVPAIPGRLLCLCGRRDPLMPAEDVAQLRDALAACERQPPHGLLELDAGHGFLCDQRADHCPAAASEAWQRILAFFGESLG